MKFGSWLIAGGPAPGDGPYLCRCHERKGPVCSAAWCPCAGRPDPPTAGCCANWFGPAQHMEAMAEWKAKKLRKEAEGLT
jgi:hypothetical protein